MYAHILVPFDGSEPAQAALNEAIALATQLGSRLRLVYAVVGLEWSAELSGVIDTDALRRSDVRHGKDLLGSALQRALGNGLDAEISLRDDVGGRPGQAIVAEVQAADCDLDVMGTHGRRGLSRLLMGSDAAVVVAESPVPVLLVRSDAITRRSALAGDEMGRAAHAGAPASTRCRGAQPARAPTW